MSALPIANTERSTSDSLGDVSAITALQITVECPNRGHFGTAAFFLSSEVVLFSEVV